MAEAAQRLLTVDEFLAWDDDTDARHELMDGVILAMAPPSNAHGTVVANVLVRLRGELAPARGWRAQIEAGVRISDRTWWQADTAVSCAPIVEGSEIAEPVLIVEVLSPITRTHDLGRKLDDYKSLSSVSEIWMIDSERRWAQVRKREGGLWTGCDHVGTSSFDSDILEARVELAHLYEHSGR